MNSHLLPLFISYRSSAEKLIKYQANSSCVIMSVILMTTLFYKALILQGEIWCWSLLGLKGLTKMSRKWHWAGKMLMLLAQRTCWNSSCFFQALIGLVIHLSGRRKESPSTNQPYQYLTSHHMSAIMVVFILETDNLSSKSVKIDGKQMDKVRRIAHQKLRPFHFQLKTFIIGLTQIIQRITHLRWIIRL